MQIIKAIPFRAIPGQSRLFLEYLDWSAGVCPFYPLPPTMDSIEIYARSCASHARIPRGALAEILRRQNAAFGADTAPIQDLENPHGVAIVTGQQVGIFTGPLYTIYKALTAIKIADKLRSRGIPAVPVFWMDTDDHDLAEVTRLALIGPDGHVRIADYRQALFGDSGDSLRPVGSIMFPESIAQAVTSLADALPDSAHKPEISNLLGSTYLAGATFAHAFASLLARIFNGRGLIFFDPRDPEAKWLAKDVFRKVLLTHSQIASGLLQRSRALEAARFHAQVAVLENSTSLFLETDGKRRPIIQQGQDFILKNTEIALNLEDLLSIAGTEPGRFSPNALLRPIYQDHLFPTAAYVGGPSEIAYFAQVEVLYRHFEYPMPVIWPRAGFTLLSQEIKSTLDRFEMQMEECLWGKQAILEKLVRHEANSGTEALVRELAGSLDRSLEGIRPALIETDATLGPALDNARKKILHQTESLRNRLVQLEARRNSLLAEKAESIMSHCYPNGKLQEREMNIIPFLAQYGSALLDRLYEVLTPEVFAHQIAVL